MQFLVRHYRILHVHYIKDTVYTRLPIHTVTVVLIFNVHEAAKNSSILIYAMCYYHGYVNYNPCEVFF